MNSELKVSIGINPNQSIDPNLYTRVNFDFELKTQSINQINNQLRKKLSRTQLPFLVFEIPSSIKDIYFHLISNPPDIDKLKFQVVQSVEKVYKCLTPNDQQMMATIKKLEKVFGKLTDLNNQIYLHLELHNVDKFSQRLKTQKDHPWTVFLDKSKIEGRFSLDPAFFKTLTDLIGKLSPKLAQSPLLSAIQLFKGVQCDLQLDSLSELSQQSKNQIFPPSDLNNSTEEFTNNLKPYLQNKQKICIYFTFGNLAVLRISIQGRMLALANYLF